MVLAHGVTNGLSPEELIQTLRETEEAVRSRLQVEHLADHPRVKSWREAYRSFGAKPSEFRSSIEAMVRRVLRGEPLPAINALVDIGNIISLRHLIPAGGHAIDVLTGDIALRLATGQEEFTPFGSDRKEHPLPGEIIFIEGETAIPGDGPGARPIIPWPVRHPDTSTTWTAFRQFHANEIEQAGHELIELVGRICGGRLRL